MSTGIVFFNRTAVRSASCNKVQSLALLKPYEKTQFSLQYTRKNYDKK